MGNLINNQTMPVVSNFLQKINPFELKPMTNNEVKTEKPSPLDKGEDGENSGNKGKLDDNSFEEIIEEPEKQESFFNPSVVDTKDLKQNSNKNNTIENLSKVLKIVEILKKNPLENSNTSGSEEKSENSASPVSKDPRLKKKN